MGREGSWEGKEELGRKELEREGKIRDGGRGELGREVRKKRGKEEGREGGREGGKEGREGKRGGR